MKQNLLALFSGIIFGIGMCVSRMANPNKVLNFLDFAGNWDPSLLFVMAGALAVTLISFRFILKRDVPLLTIKFQLPTGTAIDAKLITGATLFGLGWGMLGYCPGPVVTAIGFGFVEPYLVISFMMLGFIAHKLIFEDMETPTTQHG